MDDSAVDLRLAPAEDFPACNYHAPTIASLDLAERSGDLPSALRAVRKARRSLELLGRLDGSLDGPAATGGPTTVALVYADKALVTSPAAPRLLEDRESE